MKLRKQLHLQICDFALPTPSLGITSYARTSTLKRGIVKKAKRGACVLLSTAPTQPLGSAHLTAPQCCVIQAPNRNTCSTRLPLERHASGVMSPPWQGGVTSPPLLAPQGWMGTSSVGRQDGSLEYL